MTLKQVLKKYQNKPWVEEEAYCTLHVVDHWKDFYMATRKVYGRKLHSVIIYLCDHEYIYEWNLVEDNLESFDWLVNKYQKDRKYFATRLKGLKKVVAEVDRFFNQVKKTDLNQISDKQLKKWFLYNQHLNREGYGYSMLAEINDVVNEDYYMEILPGIGIDVVGDVISTLSTPVETTFMDKEHLDLLDLCLLVLKDKKLKQAVAKQSKKISGWPEFYKRLNKHRDDYFWIQNSFYKTKNLKINYFLNNINDVLKKKKASDIRQEIRQIKNKKTILKIKRQQIYKKYQISTQAKSYFSLVRYLSLLQDLRKDSVLKIVYGVDAFLNEVSHRRKVDRKKLNDYLVDDVCALIDKNKKISTSILNKRQKTCFVTYWQGDKIKTDTFHGRDVDKIKTEFRKHQQGLMAKQSTKGFVASKGKGQEIIEGKAKIVFYPGKEKFNKGEILVTGMTRPEFVPLMKQAKAVVTNEGGITTHAAIVSRELKIPCIIGTKVATDIFKNGDKIRLNLKQGTVTKI